MLGVAAEASAESCVARVNQLRVDQTRWLEISFVSEEKFAGAHEKLTAHILTIGR